MNKFVLFSIVMIAVLSKSCIGFMDNIMNDERYKAIKEKVCIKDGLTEKQWTAYEECNKMEGHEDMKEKMKKIYTDCKEKATDVKEILTNNDVHDKYILMMCSPEFMKCQHTGWAGNKNHTMTDEQKKAWGGHKNHTMTDDQKKAWKQKLDEKLDCSKKAVESA